MSDVVLYENGPRAAVLRLPRHVLDRDGWAAEHGLSSCGVCCGAEGSMPEHCPGRPLTEWESDAIASDELDFRVSQGGWTRYTRHKELNNRVRYE